MITEFTSRANDYPKYKNHGLVAFDYNLVRIWYAKVFDAQKMSYYIFHGVSNDIS